MGTKSTAGYYARRAAFTAKQCIRLAEFRGASASHVECSAALAGLMAKIAINHAAEVLDDDEDPPCQCWQITEDIADASFCPVHGTLTPEPMPTPSDVPDKDVAF